MCRCENDRKLPGLGRLLLWLSLNFEEYHQAAGDFEEAYLDRIQIRGKLRAYGWLCWQMVRSLPIFLLEYIFWSIEMIKNNLKIAVRIIKRQKLFSFLNIFGLGLSLISSAVIMFHVKEELSYEKSYPKSERIYRVRSDAQYGSTIRHWGATAPALGPALLESIPEIEGACRIRDLGREIISFDPGNGAVVRFSERDGFFAETSFVSIFDLHFQKGDPLTALKDPQSIVLTESLSTKYFGRDDPMGKVLVNENLGKSLRVTGIIDDFPRNTHLRIDYLISMPTFFQYLSDLGSEQLINHRTWKALSTYVLMRPGHSAGSFEQKAKAFKDKFLAEFPDRKEEFHLQPIRSIHLHSKLEGEIGPNSDVAYVYIFAGVAVLILLIAGVNFVNLSTAQSFKRMKEIGVRKVVGARKGQLIKQHLGESFLIMAAAAVFTLPGLNFAISFYNRITGRAVSFLDFVTLDNVLSLGLLMVVLSLLAGIYPALFASGFRPVNTIKRLKDPRSTAVRLREGLVVFQFVISIFMIFCTLTMYRQLDFFHNKDLGFDKNQVIAVMLYGDMGESIIREVDALKTEILRSPHVSAVGLTSNLPGTSSSNERLSPVYVEDKNTLPLLRFIRVDEDYLNTLGLDLVQGRNFSRASDKIGGYIISESTAAILELDDPLGIECRSDIHSGTAPIVGVIKDYHHMSLHNSIEPLVLEYSPERTGFLLVKIRDSRFVEALDFLKNKFADIAPDMMFQYYFVDEVFDRNYAMEDRSFDLFKVFSTLALIVACLGLLGLAVFAAEVRVKEIGIRKVLGASAPNIMVMLSSQFIRWVLLANAAAWPLAYFVMNKWLENFAFRVHINVWTFILSAGLAFLFAMATVGYQAVRSAISSPVDSLRYE